MKTPKRKNQLRKSQKKNISRKTKSVTKLTPKLFKEYNQLSPFELKGKLISLASKSGGKVLNAGRGNPNFFNSFVREVFARLQTLAVSNSPKRAFDIRLWPTIEEKNYLKVFKSNIQSWNNRDRSFFDSYLNYVIKRNKQVNEHSTNFILHDIYLSTLGTFYPSPPRIQPHLSLIAREFLYNLVTGNGIYKFKNNLKMDDFECFPTEGAAAAILYIFNSLKENFLLRENDSIALITPIFSPYLELPILKDYKLNIIQLKGNPEKEYSLDDDEMDKLKDKKIKALFMVNPANPSSFSLSKQNIDYIAKIVNTERKELIILTDNVYAPFANEYNSFLIKCPYNTIEVYSLSKYFGTTGWRLGICLLAKNNIFNKLIHNLSVKDTKLTNKRYAIASLKPSTIPFIERLLLDSRQIAEGHVAGLSTPQQVLMGLFMYYQLYSRKYEDNKYSNEIKGILINRIRLLYKNLNTKPPIVPVGTNYYSLLDIPQITENLFGKEASDYLVKNYEYIEFLFHLASKYGTVLLPGAGFGSTPWKIRISLANLDEKSYSTIGINIKNAINDLIN